MALLYIRNNEVSSNTTLIFLSFFLSAALQMFPHYVPSAGLW